MPSRTDRAKGYARKHFVVAFLTHNASPELLLDLRQYMVENNSTPADLEIINQAYRIRKEKHNMIIRKDGTNLVQAALVTIADSDDFSVSFDARDTEATYRLIMSHDEIARLYDESVRALASRVRLLKAKKAKEGAR
jgi:hypothetical protein